MSVAATAFDQRETKEGYTSAVCSTIPSVLKAAGIRFRLPRWETLRKTYSSALNPPRQRHSDDVYATLCMKLIRSLTGPIRSWATREFLYSDTDRAWYVLWQLGSSLWTRANVLLSCTGSIEMRYESMSVNWV